MGAAGTERVVGEQRNAWKRERHVKEGIVGLRGKVHSYCVFLTLCELAFERFETVDTWFYDDM